MFQGLAVAAPMLVLEIYAAPPSWAQGLVGSQRSNQAGWLCSDGVRTWGSHRWASTQAWVPRKASQRLCGSEKMWVVEGKGGRKAYWAENTNAENTCPFEEPVISEWLECPGKRQSFSVCPSSVSLFFSLWRAVFFFSSFSMETDTFVICHIYFIICLISLYFIKLHTIIIIYESLYYVNTYFIICHICQIYDIYFAFFLILSHCSAFTCADSSA